MAGIVERSSAQLKNDKPVVVRVKRKASQSCLDALWLEINERPSKRPLLDFGKLSISSSFKKEEELTSRKVFVRHVETVTNPDVSADTLQSFLSTSCDAFPSKEKCADVRPAFKTENASTRNAQFEQIRKSEKEKKDFVLEGRDEMCRIYDVVRVDVEMKSKVDRLSEIEDCKMMSNFLPLLREFLPSAATEVEADIHVSLSERDMADDYVYDYYAVEDNMDITMEDAAILFPLVKIEDDDTYYEGPDESDDESYDSNAENNPLNDYPDEESSDNDANEVTDDDDDDDDDDDEDESETREQLSSVESDDDDGGGRRSQRSYEAEEYGENEWSDDGGDYSYEVYDSVDVESEYYDMDS